jgi:hypothetical protein
MIVEYGGWGLTIVTVIMFETIYISKFGWDLQDGGSEEGKKLNKKAIVNFPPLLEYLAAAFCGTQTFAGPSTNFKDFVDFIYRRNEFEKIPESHTKESLKRALLGLFYTIVHAVTSKLFPFHLLYSLEDNYNVFYKVFSDPKICRDFYC